MEYKDAWEYLALPEVQQRIMAGIAPAADDSFRREVTEQIALRSKAAEKLPSLSGKPFLFTARALEQCSGDTAAAYKTGIITGESVCDITGGLGMDTMAFHGAGMRVVHCERNPVLARIFSLNNPEDAATGLTAITGDGVAHLKTVPDNGFTWIYADPDRRSKGKRHVALHTCEPDVVSLMPLLLAKAGHVCIKVSPALEISEAVKQLPQLTDVYVVSVDGACKEILLICDRHGAQGNPVLHVAALDSKEGSHRYWDTLFSAAGPGGHAAECTENLFVPDAALIKSRCGDMFAAENGMAVLQAGQNLYTGQDIPVDAPGKAYRVTAQWPWHRKAVGNALAKRGVSACTLHVYWHKTDQAAARKLLKIDKADNEIHLFLCYGQGGKKMAVLAERQTADIDEGTHPLNPPL